MPLQTPAASYVAAVPHSDLATAQDCSATGGGRVSGTSTQHNPALKTTYMPMQAIICDQMGESTLYSHWLQNAADPRDPAAWWAQGRSPK
ncbi:hypothetical protein MBOE_57840 [Mycolicibacterium boenickei]|uniref:Uncharacterized protein n=1 Tax=Mycolicibacterium boenickei TaxID=146017 RepID=A0ABM7J4H4_9MYCO|nr:hypothetical protein MBOE_57840 [Mycolicibacterium boenickei]